MKALLLAIATGTALLSAPAMATTYFTHCSTCGIGSSSPDTIAAAVGLGASNGAVVNDLLDVCVNLPNPNRSVIHEYVVTGYPVVDDTDIQWSYSQGYVDMRCEDF